MKAEIGLFIIYKLQRKKSPTFSPVIEENKD
jgi:hypothetical protein